MIERLQKYNHSPRRSPAATFEARFSPSPSMPNLRDFYRQYRQYIGTDGLMYLVFVLVLALLFVFFG